MGLIEEVGKMKKAIDAENPLDMAHGFSSRLRGYADRLEDRAIKDKSLLGIRLLLQELKGDLDFVRRKVDPKTWEIEQR